jgi:transcriptional regulatory protein LevR
VNNNISKSTLILSVHQLCEQYKNVFYFPAYELVTDDLRDYRFYKEDMSHPNELAIQYILEKFSQSLLSSNAKQIVQELEKIINALQHKIINKNSSKIKEFAINFIQQCERLESKYPYLKLNEEKNYFKDLLNEKITPLK